MEGFDSFDFVLLSSFKFLLLLDVNTNRSQHTLYVDSSVLDCLDEIISPRLNKTKIAE